MQGIYRVTAPSLGDGDQTQLRVDSSGRMITATASPTTNDLTAARISFSATGDQTIVSATAAQSTKVYRLRLTVAGATNISIKDGAASTLEVIQFPAAGILVLDFNTRPYWTTTANTAFILNSSAAVAVEGRIEYLKN